MRRLIYVFVFSFHIKMKGNLINFAHRAKSCRSNRPVNCGWVGVAKRLPPSPASQQCRVQCGLQGDGRTLFSRPGSQNTVRYRQVMKTELCALHQKADAAAIGSQLQPSDATEIHSGIEEFMKTICFYQRDT
jgi:hypothetical protein